MQVNPAALPGRADEDLLDRRLQAQMSIRDHELDADKPSNPEALEELGPEDLVLRVADREPEDLPVAVSCDPHGHDDGPRDDSIVHPALDVSGIQEDVGIGGVTE